MELHETIWHILLGVSIGYILGRFHSYLREIKEELDEVDDIVKGQRAQDEKGIVQHRIALNVALAVVVLLSLWASISSQIQSDDLQDTNSDLKTAQADLKDAQSAIKRIGVCNQVSLTQLVQALNERVGYTQGRADADVALTKSEAKFWTLILTEPPPSPEEGRAALEKYLGLINDFVKASAEAKIKGNEFPYPTEEELKACYTAADLKTQEKQDAAE